MRRVSAVFWFVATVLLLASCGGGAPEESGSGEKTPQTRAVEHALGTSKVPEEPQRVVDLAGGAGVDRLLTLGIVPVASWGAPGDETGVPTWFEDVDWPVEVEAGEIENVAGGESVSIEKIAALEPDLIIGYDYAFEGIYEELSEIAPSVGIEPANGPEWKESFRRTAEVVWREAEYEEWLSGYDEKLEELRSGAQAEGKTVSLLWNGDPSAVRIYASGSQPGTIVEEAGFELPGIAQVEEGGPIPGVPSPNVSLEQIPEVDADAVFIMTDLQDDPAALDEFEATYAASPLWERLEAVQRGQVYPVDIYLWTNGGPAGIRDVMLPELFAAFE